MSEGTSMPPRPRPRDSSAGTRVTSPAGNSAGYAPAAVDFPVEYPTACSPQAWATGAPLMLLRVLLGLEPAGRELRTDPQLPERISSLEPRGIRGRGGRVD